jgi:hypothetical protein
VRRARAGADTKLVHPNPPDTYWQPAPPRPPRPRPEVPTAVYVLLTLVFILVLANTALLLYIFGVVHSVVSSFEDLRNAFAGFN